MFNKKSKKDKELKELLEGIKDFRELLEKNLCSEIHATGDGIVKMTGSGKSLLALYAGITASMYNVKGINNEEVLSKIFILVAKKMRTNPEGRDENIKDAIDYIKSLD